MITEDPNKKYTAHMTNMLVTYGYDDAAKVLFVAFQPKPPHKHMLMKHINFQKDSECVVASANRSGGIDAVLLFFSKADFERYAAAHPGYVLKMLDGYLETL
jgi:hypothetical protein